LASWSEVKGLKYLILTHTTYSIFNIDHHTNPRSIIHYRLLPEWILWIWKYCHHQGVRRSRYLLWRSFQFSKRYMTSSSFRFVSHQDDLIWFDFWCFSATFSNISATTGFSGGRSQSTQREPSTMGKQLVNLITCGCESSASFFVIYKAGCEPTSYWW
jgi:hypothetical protein